MSSHVKYKQTKNDVIYFQYFDDTYLAQTLLFYIILTRMSWVQPKEGALHFILSNNDNYDFDVKVERCGFVSFVYFVVNCGCLECVFCFIIK